MMIKNAKKIFLLFLIIFTLTPIFGFAQSRIALELSPLKNFFSIEPGQSQTGEIFVKNLSSVSLKIKPRVVAFTTVDDRGTLKIEEGDYQDYVSLPVSVFELVPGEKRQINFSVYAPKNEAGGKYFAILFASEPIQASGTQFSGEVGSLVFLEILNGLKQEIKIEEFNSKKIFWNEPIFNVALKNTGNTHATPFGEIKILNWLGNEKETIAVNFPQILPGKKRSLSFVSQKSLFGKYNAKLNIVDADWNFISKQISFWVLPWINLLALTIFLIIIIIFILVLIRKKTHA